jgi:hypothetical protein
MKKLPKTPSKLLRIALTDLMAVEKSKKYRIDMGMWHHGAVEGGQKCEVCMAGAVMAKTLKVPDDEWRDPGDFNSSDITKKLFAINLLRVGNISEACYFLGVKNKANMQVPVISYDDSPKEFKKDMRKLIKTLEKAGM